jgi:large subunit ribosomal protein L27
MSLLGLISKFQPSQGFLSPLAGSVFSDIVRNASKKAGASTRNKCRNTPGKRRGIKVYDGQRVPHGKLLVKQLRLQVLPGWNTKMLSTCNIVGLTHGRVMLTTEKIEPKLEAYSNLPSRLGDVLPKYLQNENIYRVHVHVVPDEQHQYFKLVDQV